MKKARAGNREGETTDGQIRSDYCYSLPETNRCTRMERRKGEKR